MKTSPRLAAVAAVVAAAAVGLVFIGADSSATPAAPEAAVAAPARAALRFDWPAGQKLVYRLRWSADTRTRLGVGDGTERALDGVTDLGGMLTLRSFGPTPGGTLLGLSLSGLEPHSMRALGTELLADARTVEGHEAYLVMRPDGALAQVYLRPSDPDVFKLVAQWLATDLAVTLGPDEAWSALEESSLGLAQSSYARGPGEQLTRTRSRYLSLRGVPGGHVDGVTPLLGSRAALTLEDGHLKALSSRETVRVASTYEGDVKTELELVSSGVEDVRPVSLEGLETRRVGEVVLADDTGRRLLEDRAAGLTIDRLVSDLGTWGNTGELPDHARWLWRAVGALKLHPERAAELVPLFHAPGATSKGRLLLLDLLAAAGHTHAQEVLRELLESDDAKHDLQSAAMLQRAGLVARPEAQTVALVERRLGSRGDEGVAAAFTACSMAGKLEASGDRARAAKLSGHVRAELQRETDPERRALLMRALGNSGSAADRDAVLSQRGDVNPRVRAAVAVALRRDASEEAAHALASLAGDVDPAVQRAALGALALHDPSPQTVQQVVSLLAGGRMDQGCDPAIVDLLARAERTPQVTQALQLLLGRAEHTPELAARIGDLLTR
ncbi:MAG: HEAT repeat domain-containing protein [Myxococcaceae bacterium]|nr:HEAT repeat domain-containing protein [Myxococcaceae bacterium]